jgi:hypothetical protein
MRTPLQLALGAVLLLAACRENPMHTALPPGHRSLDNRVGHCVVPSLARGDGPAIDAGHPQGADCDIGTHEDGTASSVLAPSNLTGSEASPMQIDLSWIDGNTNETGFVLQRRKLDPDNTWGSWTHVANLPAGTTSDGDTGLTPATTYQYRIRASNVFGCSSWSNKPLVSTPQLPS